MGLLQDAIAGALPYLRDEATARMTSTVTIKRRNGETVQNETTGVVAKVWTITHTDQPARLGPFGVGGAGGRDKAFKPGDVAVEWAERVLHLPHDTDDLQDGDIVEVTAGENTGTFWRIVESSWADQMTAHRLPILETTRPEGW